MMRYLGGGLNGAVDLDKANLVRHQNLLHSDATPVASSKLGDGIILATDGRVVDQVLNGLLRQ
jgi:hypothetical protein